MNEKEYIALLMQEYNLTYQGVASLKHRWKLQRYSSVFIECKYRDNLKKMLLCMMMHKKASELKDMFMHTKYPNSNAVSFVNYLYSKKDKGVVSDSAKNRYIIALELLKGKENELEY